jgi:hypothetical protein
VTNRALKKARNLLANSKVAIHLESGDDVVSFQGKVAEVSDSSRLVQVAVAYSAKYDGDEINQDTKGEFGLPPHLAFSWLESNYHQTETR